MNSYHKPLIINKDGAYIFGVLRGNIKNENLVILVPALSGTRIGPQRIYVELAQRLSRLNISSFCADIPPLGDSYDINSKKYIGLYSERLTQHFSKYLQLIIDFFNKEYQLKKITLLSISEGCLPVYRFACRTKIPHLILLSPNHLLDEIQRVNIKNIRAYLAKITSINTWKKIIGFGIDIKSVYRNIFHLKREKRYSKQYVEQNVSAIEDCLVILGEKDEKSKTYEIYWKNEYSKGRIKNIHFETIQGADHSYFGWRFKREVEKAIYDHIITV